MTVSKLVSLVFLQFIFCNQNWFISKDLISADLTFLTSFSINPTGSCCKVLRRGNMLRSFTFVCAGRTTPSVIRGVHQDLVVRTYPSSVTLFQCRWLFVIFLYAIQSQSNKKVLFLFFLKKKERKEKLQVIYLRSPGLKRLHVAPLNPSSKIHFLL